MLLQCSKYKLVPGKCEWVLWKQEVQVFWIRKAHVGRNSASRALDACLLIWSPNHEQAISTPQPVALNFPAWQTHACVSPKLHQMYPVPKERGPTPTTSDTNFEDNWNCPLSRLNFDTLPALEKSKHIYPWGLNEYWLAPCKICENMSKLMTCSQKTIHAQKSRILYLFTDDLLYRSHIAIDFLDCFLEEVGQKGREVTC